MNLGVIVVMTLKSKMNKSLSSSRNTSAVLRNRERVRIVSGIYQGRSGKINGVSDDKKECLVIFDGKGWPDQAWVKSSDVTSMFAPVVFKPSRHATT